MELQREKTIIASEILLNSMLSAVDELLVVVDKEGYIEAISNAYAEFLNMDPKKIVGRHVSEIIENTRMDIVVKTGIPEIGNVQQINGQKMIASRIPIFQDGKVIGAFGRVLFRNVEDLRALYQKMDAMEQELSLYKKMFGKINSARYQVNDIIGESPIMIHLKDALKEISKTMSNVLILGESGTGKELFAHAIHNSSHRKNAPFVTVNCGTLPTELIEAELFGYEEGAFTGAKKGGKPGLFQTANNGTIFLDEIGDLPLHMQVKLLRVLQEKEVQRIGATVCEPINVRIIAATNRDLYQMVQEGIFRADLYYRLNVVTIHVPALRERRDDIPLLAKMLVQKFAKREGIIIEGISKNAMDCFMRYTWPGNVREMENALERAINFVGNSRWVEVNHLPASITNVIGIPISRTLKDVTEEAERTAILETLAQYRQSKSQTAMALGISRTTLYEKIEKYGI